MCYLLLLNFRRGKIYEKKMIFLLVFILGLTFVAIFLNNKEEKPYSNATSKLTLISKEEVNKKILDSADFVIFVGRDTCPYCVDFAEKLNEINSMYTDTIYYLDTENFTQKDKALMDQLNIQYIPVLVKVVKGNSLLIDTDLPTPEIINKLK